MRTPSPLDSFALLAVAVLLAACSSSGDPASGPFSGTWTCSSVSSLTYTTPPNSTPAETHSTEQLFVVTSGSTIATQASSDAGATCPQTYAVSGSSITLVPSAPCVAQGLSFTYSSGTGTLTNGALDIDLVFSFTGSLATDGGTVAVAGTGTTTDVCTR